MHSPRFRLRLPRPLGLVAVLAWVGLMVTGMTGCTSHSTTTPCSTVGACTTAGSQRFGQAVVTPRGATFVQGSIKKGVLGIDFLDRPGGPAYKEFVGPASLALVRVGSPTGSAAVWAPTETCPGPTITVTPTKRFCYGATRTGLVAQFAAGKLVYVVLFNVPPADAAPDQALITRIVSSLS